MTGQVPAGWERRVRADLAACETDDRSVNAGLGFLRMPPLSPADREALRCQVLADPGGFYAAMAATEQAQVRRAAGGVWSELVHGRPDGEADAGDAG